MNFWAYVCLFLCFVYSEATSGSVQGLYDCTHGALFAGLEDYMWYQGIEPESTSCQASSLLTVLSLYPHGYMFFICFKAVHVKLVGSYSKSTETFAFPDTNVWLTAEKS